MKVVYLLLSVLGYGITMVPMLMYSFETGNILFWTKPDMTTSLLFSSIGVTTFTLDLLITAAIFSLWSFVDSRKRNARMPWIWCALTLLFGMAGTLPLFLYSRTTDH